MRIQTTSDDEEEFQQQVINLYAQVGLTPLPFQHDAARYFFKIQSGLLVAPTGSGKTLALLAPLLISLKNSCLLNTGLPSVLWITPLRALARDLSARMQRSTVDFGINATVALRTGDTSAQSKSALKRQPPDILITTPESGHVLLSQIAEQDLLGGVQVVVVDEWHEFLGTKRGTQVELLLSYLRVRNPRLRTWGLSATLGHVEEACKVLCPEGKGVFLQPTTVSKETAISVLLPQSIERFPWSGHIGLKLLPQVLQVIEPYKSVLVFTNTRSQAELWFQALIAACPDRVEKIAIHHGSLEKDERAFVEDGIRNGTFEIVVATSSLELGIDLYPVEAVVQVGSPKSVARFLQRAGRSGHAPGSKSIVYFVPTHALEIVEAVALRRACAEGVMEARSSLHQPLDVLLQYIVTRGCGDGFQPLDLFDEIRSSFAYKDITYQEFEWCLAFLIDGGKALGAYKEYKRLVHRDGFVKLEDSKQRKIHQINIGTIVTTSSIKVVYESGKALGSVEEGFLLGMKPGDVFLLGGQSLELVRIKDSNLVVRRAKSRRGRVPRWQGGRMPLSAEFAHLLRAEINKLSSDKKFSLYEERELLRPLFDLQRRWSALPREDELLIEKIRSDEGYHLFVYPFEGRLIHEGMALYLSHKLAQVTPRSFSLAMNDYGFEIMSDQDFWTEDILSLVLIDDVQEVFREILNTTELAKRQFREIAQIAGLVSQGFAGKQRRMKQQQISASLLFTVFQKYDPDNLLLLQASSEVLARCLGGADLRDALHRLKTCKTVSRKPQYITPFAFPILVDRLREEVSSEKLDKRIEQLVSFLETQGTT